MAKTETAVAPQEETTTIKTSDLQALIARLEKLEQNNQGGVPQAALTEQMTQFGAGLVKALQQAFPEIAENDYNAISPLNPQGEKVNPRGQGDLMHQDAQGREREVFWHTVLDWRQQTPEEIRAWNAIQSDCEARNGKWTARVEPHKGTKPGGRLTVKTSDNSPDARASMPSELAVALELAGGPKTVDLATMLRKMKDMEAELEALKTGKAVAKK